MRIRVKDKNQVCLYLHRNSRLSVTTVVTQVPLQVVDNSDRDGSSRVRSWGSHTTLVRGPGRELNLTTQTHEVKAVVRIAIPNILRRVIFEDFYPSSTTRAAWHKKTMIAAACHLKRSAAQNGNESVARRYGAVEDRLKGDDDYCPTLGKIVCSCIYSTSPTDVNEQLDGCIPIFRNNFKSSCEEMIKSQFKLRVSCTNAIEWYLTKMRYVYPCDAEVSHSTSLINAMLLHPRFCRPRRWTHDAHIRTTLCCRPFLCST